MKKELKATFDALAQRDDLDQAQKIAILQFNHSAEDLKEAFLEAQDAKAAIDAQAAPLIAEREKLWEKIHPIRAKIDGISDQVKEIHSEADYMGITQTISLFAKAAGGRSMGDGKGDREQ